MELKQYTKFEKDFGKASFISAPEKELLKFNRPKDPNFPDAAYVWPVGCTRFHAYRLFTPKKEVAKLEAAFTCDNIMDLWLNGKQFADEVQVLPLTDITELLVDGENNLHIRAYQSNTDERFSSAMTGGIRITYTDGEVEEIVTDESFNQVQLVNFWVMDEPDGFETATAIDVGRGGPSPLYSLPMHPIALRRSFYYIRQFELKEMPVGAKLYSTALGAYEPYMNGKRITDSFFMPFCMNFQKEYQEFDILPMLNEGKNTIGAILGNGSYNCRSWGSLWANEPEFMAIIEFTYSDGRTEYIYTDEEWLCTPSPLVDNDIQYGERYDARLETPDWCDADVDASEFASVVARPNTDNVMLLSQPYPLIKKTEERVCTEYTLIGENTPMYDSGLCVAGRARITFKNLPAGKKVRIRYCEHLKDDGMPENGAYVCVFYQQDCAPGGKSEQFMRNMDVYYAKGEPEETYECRFSYTGYRYIWIEGLDSVDQVKEVVALEIRTDLKSVSEIKTDNQMIMDIHKATKRSWFNNIHNGPTDCPTREKNFWNGDTQIFSHTACWLTDNSDFLARWTDNGVKMHAGPWAWEDETYEIPYTLYRFYGDKEILRVRFAEMVKLVEKRIESPDMVLPTNNGWQYCDWLNPTGENPSTVFFGGCWYYHMLDRVSEIADIIGETEKRDEYRKMADAVRDEFNRINLVDNGTDYSARNQCGIVLPLAFGIAPEENREALAKTLVEYIKKADYHVTTGFVGSRYLPEVLADCGYKDVVYKLLMQKTFPSWGFILDTGATAITESWWGHNDEDRSLGMCHFSLGAVSGWFYEYLGGIRINDSAPGLTEVVFKPYMIKEIGNFAVTYQSQLGEISTEWHFEGDKPVFSYKVPEGVKATVIIPE
ncbi:MAG: family 78 glycoside hydrolase catalytic domain [Clostridia bacterium]|nr:family 78 glycoside hydrolase catalytic domain [Clostridia bacterium]